MWAPFDDGRTIGTFGSEGGTILLDDEHSRGARVTLEKGGPIAPFAITCGVYGWMFHTSFFSTQQNADTAYAAMKQGLSDILGLIPLADDPHVDEQRNRVYLAITEFVARFQ
jgi:hypothetical protein